MDSLMLEGTGDTPKVIFDKGNDHFEISGCSLPEDTNAFFEPIIDWLEEYLKSPNEATQFEFALEYFNTASSKIFLDIFTRFEKLKQAGKQVRVKWVYDEDDEDMEMAGQEYAKLCDVEFEFLPVEGDDDDDF